MIHVIDVSSPAFEEHMTVVDQTLADIGASEIRTIKVYNKIDAVKLPESETEEVIEEVIDAPSAAERIFSGEKFNKKDLSFRMSSLNKSDVNQFRKVLYEEVKNKHLKIYPHYLEPQIYDPEGEESEG